MNMTQNGLSTAGNDVDMWQVDLEDPLDMAQLFVIDNEDDNFEGYHSDWVTDQDPFMSKHSGCFP